MKRLTLIRHCKSVAADPWQRDFERPLSARGRRDAGLVGVHLTAWPEGKPDRVVVSAALRTRETAAALAEAGAWPKGCEIFEDRIYEAPLEALQTVLAEQPDGAGHVVMVGHNPGMELMLEWLCPRELRPVVTGAVISMELAADSWGEVPSGCGRLLRFVRPADLGGGPD
jgi:phosphohistidine phosphatase